MPAKCDRHFAKKLRSAKALCRRVSKNLQPRCETLVARANADYKRGRCKRAARNLRFALRGYIRFRNRTLGKSPEQYSKLPNKAETWKILLETSGIDDHDFARADARYEAWKRGEGPKPPPWRGGELDAVNNYLGLRKDKRAISARHAFDLLTKNVRKWSDLPEAIDVMQEIPGFENLRLPEEAYERDWKAQEKEYYESMYQPDPYYQDDFDLFGLGFWSLGEALKKLKTGQNAVYPGHGVVKVVDTETKVFGDKKHKFYVLEILNTGSKVFVPEEAVEKTGIRSVISGSKAKEVFQALRKSDYSINPEDPWNRRYRQYMDKVKSGDSVSIAEAMSDICLIKKDKGKISFGEKKMFSNAEDMLAPEIALATGESEASVRDKIKETCGA